VSSSTTARGWLDGARLGYGIEDYVSVNLNLTQRADPRERFHQLVASWPEVISAAIVTGETQYVLHVRARDMQHFSEFVIERRIGKSIRPRLRCSARFGHSPAPRSRFDGAQ